MFERIRAKLCVDPFSRWKCVPIEKINNLSRIINYYLEPFCGTMAGMNSNTPKRSGTSMGAVAGASASPRAQVTDGKTTGGPVGQGALEDPESMENQPVIYRKVLLRIVFWALGLAACFGAAAVIFAGHDTLWRIVETCVR